MVNSFRYRSGRGKGLIRCFLTALLLQMACMQPCHAEQETDSIQVVKPNKWRHVTERLYQRVKAFSHIDTAYVEAQKYNFTVMVQSINTYETYRVSSSSGQSVRFSPKPSMKVGPYVGWRWIVWGYTVDFSHLSDGHKKQDFMVSLYSNQVGLDLFYRKTGNDYRIKDLNLGPAVNTSSLENMTFDGIRASIKGFNLYYIFNHKRFSYPAAYSQSTRQLRNAGSVLAGFGYTRHSLSIDWNKLQTLIDDELQPSSDEATLNPDLKFQSIHYTDISLSLGYAYNWVFAHNWLFNSSLSLALGHKHTSGDLAENNFLFKGFSLENFNVDGVGRFGLVWNNSRWYSGASAIFHTYNYKKQQFRTNNFFGTLTLYVGYNFGKK